MDNFSIDLTAEKDESLAKALEIAFAHNAPGGKATHYKEIRLKPRVQYHARAASPHFPANTTVGQGLTTPLHVSHYEDLVQDVAGHLTLVLYWTAAKGSQKLPYSLTVTDAVPFVSGWLASNGDLGPEPDHDGDNVRGWRVFTNYWGHVAGSSYSIVGVQAVWAMRGK